MSFPLFSALSTSITAKSIKQTTYSGNTGKTQKPDLSSSVSQLDLYPLNLTYHPTYHRALKEILEIGETWAPSQKDPSHYLRLSIVKNVCQEKTGKFFIFFTAPASRRHAPKPEPLSRRPITGLIVSKIPKFTALLQTLQSSEFQHFTITRRLQARQ
jgi:hypothetical protein